MILSYALRSVERLLLLEWDAGPLDAESVLRITFADDGPDLDLTDLERAAIADEADERAWLAAQAVALDGGRHGRRA